MPPALFRTGAFSRGLESSLERRLGQRTRQRPTLRRALAADRAHGLLIVTIAICIWVALLSDAYPVVSCVYPEGYLCILLYPGVSQMYLKSSGFFRKEILNCTFPRACVLSEVEISLILNCNRRRNMTTLVACLAGSRRRSSGAHGDALNI